MDKSESIPLLESDRYELNEISDFSSTSIHYSTDYGTYRNKKGGTDTRNFIGSVSDPSDINQSQQLDQNHRDLDSSFKSVTISWNDLNCFAPELGKGAFGRVKETGLYKQLLFDVSGVVHTGKLTAIMGASGAGKSTLLNIITCRNLGNLRVDGEVRVNGEIMHSNIKSVSAYVQQMDVFWGRLKLREHLLYNAVLRMGSKYTKREKVRRVDELIAEMGLKQVENDFINTSAKVQGLAGSEKKLLSISCELLVDPPIIFLDEPTTGLDAKMAEKVVLILQKLVKKGKCILCTIHQPSSHIFSMFNDTYLLAEGRLIFQGSREHALDFFSDVGFSCAENFNPADHFIHTMAIKPGRESDCRAKVIYMARKFRDTSEYGFLRKELLAIKSNADNKSQAANKIKSFIKQTASFKATRFQEISILTWKQLLDQVRDPKLFAARIFQNIAVVLILGTFYFQQVYDQNGVTNISGVIFNVVTNVTFLAVVQLNSFVRETNFFYRENQSGMARASSYFIAKNLSEIPIFMLTTATVAFGLYWTVGLYNGFQEFLVFYLVILLVYQYSFSLNVLFIGSVFNNTDLVLNIAPLIRIVMMYMAGYLINDSSLPIYLSWLKYFSWHRYSFEILLVNQWNNVNNITCKTVQTNCFNSGSDVISFMNFSASRVVFDLIMLLVLGLVFRILSLFVIMFRSRERKLN